MAFRTLLLVVSVVALADGVIAVLAPGPFVGLLWKERVGPEAHLFIQGWGACLFALGLMTLAVRSQSDSATRQLFALGLCVYFSVASFVWLMDALAIGWTFFSAITFVGLMFFAAAFGYFRFVHPRSI
jgi:hypothetical protein